MKKPEIRVALRNGLCYHDIITLTGISYVAENRFCIRQIHILYFGIYCNVRRFVWQQTELVRFSCTVPFGAAHFVFPERVRRREKRKRGIWEMEAVILFGALVVIAIAFFIGREFGHIAEMKGHDGTKYFWWCFLFAAVGMLMVMALPDRADQAETAQVPNDELPDL